MKRFKKILVATDTRLDKHPVVDDAIEIAKRNDASLMIVDILPEQSWIAKQVTNDLDYLHNLVRKEKESKLDELAAMARKADIEVRTKLFTGKASVEIVREVLREDHDLVLAVTKGANSRTSNNYGRTARRLLATCPATVWLVAANAPSKPRHIAACLDTAQDDNTNKALNQNIYETSQAIAEQFDCKLSLLHAWKLQDEPLLRTRLKPDQVDAYRDRQLAYHKDLMEKFLKQNDGNNKNVHFLNGDVVEVVPEFVKEKNVDLVVMGTVARSGLLGLLMGNTAHSLLDHLDCSVMALKPPEFKTSIPM